MQKKIGIILQYSEWKGYYPFERAMMMKQLLTEENVTIIVKGTNERIETIVGQDCIVIHQFEELAQHYFDLLLYDGQDCTEEMAEQLRTYSNIVIHFDDRGDGALLADLHINALREESLEMLPENMVVGNFTFAPTNELLQIAHEERLTNDIPHIVVAFEDGDEHNLTYRTLRHLTQFQIPLKISIVLDQDYKHAADELQMMALSRRHTTIIQHEHALLSSLPTANIVICNSNYTPYKVATIGIPCITVAQNERELTNSFNREHNGFVHLGLGRKMKQSTIQNAVMEFLLHEIRGERAVKRQQALDLRNGHIALQNLLKQVLYKETEATTMK